MSDSEKEKLNGPKNEPKDSKKNSVHTFSSETKKLNANAQKQAETLVKVNPKPKTAGHIKSNKKEKNDKFQILPVIFYFCCLKFLVYHLFQRNTSLN